MLGVSFSSKLDRGSYIIFIAKTTSKKTETFYEVSMKFLSPDVALYLCKSTIWPFMEYCCHVLAGALSCYLELLNKFQKWICRTVGPSLAASLEHLSFFYMFYFGGFLLCYSSGRSTDYSYRLYDFSVTIPRCYKDVYVITQLDSGILSL